MATGFQAASLSERAAAADGDREARREPIAIIGIHARLPGSNTLDQFWDNLARNRDLIAPVPPDRAEWAWENPDAADACTREGGFLEGVDRFDAAFFGIQDAEARLMDPLQRLALLSAWHCVEDAGYRAADLAAEEPGVFFATGKSDFEEILYRRNVAADAKLASGIASGMIANRISFALGFSGPSLAVDTACSGSLTALHLAAQAIREGDCGMALVGAANLCLTSTLTRSLEKEGSLSPDCRTRSFDAAGNGYARGEGVIAMLLKPLARAEADKDHVYGTIIGSAVRHGGRANWLTAPNPNAQRQLIATAWRRAGADPRSITYIEAHGTATPLGDPIEFNAIRQAYSELDGTDAPDGHRCRIGSVKANIGHLEVASGLAGVVKVLLAMRHAAIPGNPQLRTPNPLCKTEGTPFDFVRETERWDRSHDRSGNAVPRRAGVSAFGFGGACGHVVVEEHRASRQERSGREADAVLQVLPISAKDGEALRRYAGSLCAFARARAANGSAAVPSELDDLLFAFQAGRTPFPARMAVMAEGWASLAGALDAFLAGRDDPRIIRAGEAPNEPSARHDELADLSLRFARQWVNGGDLDFAALYADRKRRRMPAPGYPFAERAIGLGPVRPAAQAGTAA